MQGRSTSAAAFIAGIGAGIGIGVLMAPRSGQETREQIKDTANRTRDALKGKVEDSKEIIRDTSKEISEQTKQLVGKGQEAAKKVRNRAKDEVEVADEVALG